jgi:2,4-dienoyl-CoA reductase-like NADH-dependent reductase (Old Yellow Enzyme family)
MNLLRRIERYLRETDTPAARFGREAVRDPRFVFDLRLGREPRPVTEQRVRAFLEAHQPQGPGR